MTLTQGVDYDVQWTASGEPSEAPQSGCLQVDDGWTDGLPADGDASVRGLRVILHDTDAVRLETDAQSVDVSFVVRIAKSVGNDDASGDHRVNDWMTMRWTRNDDASMTGCSPNGVWVTSPRDPYTALGLSVIATSPQGETREEEVMPADTLTYTLTPSGRDVMLSGTAITPEIRIPLPQGLADPVLDSDQWTMEVRDGAEGKELVFHAASADGKTSPQVGLTGVADLPPIVWHARVGNRATGVIQVTAGFTANLDANGAVPARSAARSAAQQSMPIAGNRIQGARLSAVRTPAEVGDDIAYTFNILARGPNRDGALTTVLRMPANEDDKAMRGEGCSSEEPDADGCTGPDGSWHDYSGAYSRYHGGWSLEEPVTLSDADSTPTQVRYSVDPVFSGNADDYTWLTWDQLQALEPSRRTVAAVELVSEFSALDEDTLTLAAANGTINLRTKGNRPDDTYVMWVGTPQFSHPDDGAQPTAPFPAQVATVASSISGILYNVVAGRMANVGDRKFVDVDTGFRHGMLLQDDGTVWNFGTNASGQLGVTGGNHQPTPVDGIRAKAIAAGVYGEYIVALDGTVYASGTNGDGQLGRGFLGDGDEGKQHVFQPVEGLKASRVWAGEHSAVALGENDRMYVWGGNGSRQLGRTGSAATAPEPFAGTIPGTPVEASIGALQWMGWEHIMMLQDDGTIVGWGNNSHTVLSGTQSQDPSQPVTVEARGSQATPATDPTAQDVAPVSERNETRADGGRDVVRAYTLPAAVAPGGRVVLHVSGEVIRSVAEQRIHNQAWFDSPHTPYGAEPDASAGEWAGVPTARDNHVTEPTPPDDANIDPNTHDVTGNVSCSTGTDTADAPDREHSFLTGGEDSCDQVGLIIPAASSEPTLGSIGGTVWRDLDHDGLRGDGEPPLAGIHVYLLDAAGERVPGCEAVTDEQGAYMFERLTLGTYGVQFEPAQRSGFTTPDVDDPTPASDGSVADSDASTDPNRLGRSTATVTLTAEAPDRRHLDAGVLPERAWLAAMPHTGLGTWTIICLGAGLLALLAGAVVLLHRR